MYPFALICHDSKNEDLFALWYFALLHQCFNFWRKIFAFALDRTQDKVQWYLVPYLITLKNKLGHSRPLFVFSYFQYSWQWVSLTFTGFEMRTSGCESDRSTKWATTNASFNASMHACFSSILHFLNNCTSGKIKVFVESVPCNDVGTFITVLFNRFIVITSKIKTEKEKFSLDKVIKDNN